LLAGVARQHSRPAHRASDPRVAAAPAHVRFQRRGDLAVTGVGVGSQQRCGPQRHARRAIPALRRPLRRQRPLDRVKSSAARKPLDGGDRPARHLSQDGLAGQHRDTVVEYGAGAALALAAAGFRAGQAEIIPEQCQHAPGRRPAQLARLAVHHGTEQRQDGAASRGVHEVCGHLLAAQLVDVRA